MMEARKTNWNFSLCPQVGGKIDWPTIETFDWVQAMKGCLQDAEHHAEGDVFQHTRMVCESLVQMDSWKNCDENSRNILFAAALLHDVAKPVSSTVDGSGKIRSLKHTRIGASMAREILWANPEFDCPGFREREEIVRLVRFSGLPLWFFEKDDPEKAVVRASLSCRLRLLAVLAEADILGRESRDKKELLERISMFCEFSQENDCFDKAYVFPSDHSRYSYFHLNSKPAQREVFDDRRGRITIMSGLPASGKDRWIIENCRDLPVISLDGIRKDLGIDPAQNQGLVITKAKGVALGLLKNGSDFVWNATNISSSMRSNLIKFMEPYKPRICIVYKEAPGLKDLKKRNRERQEPVPESVLLKLLRRLEVPELSECHELLTCIS